MTSALKNLITKLVTLFRIIGVLLLARGVSVFLGSTGSFTLVS